MARADFVFFTFDKELGGGSGNQASEDFTIEGIPLNDQAYLLLQTFDVQSDQHRIVINGHDLPVMDIAAHPTPNVWQTWMDRIPPGVLKQGKNTFTVIKKSGTDAFSVRGVSINWRENG
jgi:hypothetical protein